MLIIFDDGKYHLRIGNVWHRSLTSEEAEQLGATFDDLLLARCHALPSRPVFYDGKHFRIGACVFGICDARAHLRDGGCTIKEANAILSVAKLLHRISLAS